MNGATLVDFKTSDLLYWVIHRDGLLYATV